MAKQCSDGTQPKSWRNRIVAQEQRPVAELAKSYNARNWRKHPDSQAGALGQVLGSVGIVQGVVLNQRSEAMGWPVGTLPALVDGHLRVELARKGGETSLPVTVVDLTQEEEALVLATLDPLGALAETDAAILASLLEDVPPQEDGALADLLAALAGEGSGEPELSGESKLDGDLVFSVVIECHDEDDQRDTIERLRKEGLKCRALMS